MKANEKLMYSTIRMDAYTIIEFMHQQNFYDKELERKLDLLIEKIDKYLNNE